MVKTSFENQLIADNLIESHNERNNENGTDRCATRSFENGRISFPSHHWHN